MPNLQCLGDVTDADTGVVAMAADGEKQQMLLWRDPINARLFLREAEEPPERRAKLCLVLEVRVVEGAFTCSPGRRFLCHVSPSAALAAAAIYIANLPY